MKVYIVVEIDRYTRYRIFRNVFFKRELAENWVQEFKNYGVYSIETYKEQENGSTVEIS